MRSSDDLRHDWQIDEAQTLFARPFGDLIFDAQAAHRKYFDPNQIQLSTLLSIKTGGCPEDCGYCSQSTKFDTGLKASKLMSRDAVLDSARAAKAGGASRFCMGAAWRNPKDRDLDAVCDMLSGIRGLGLETCATLGMLTRDQADRLKDAGLDFYNHNIDTSREHYGNIVSTRTFDDRLETFDYVREAGIKVCCGGIMGLGESRFDRASMLVTLANLPVHPESVPINRLVKIEGTPLAAGETVDSFEFIRTIAVAKIMMPASVIRLAAGREQMNEEFQALCFLAGAASIFVGARLLTTPNPGRDRDEHLLGRLGLTGQETPTMTAS